MGGLAAYVEMEFSREMPMRRCPWIDLGTTGYTHLDELLHQLWFGLQAESYGDRVSYFTIKD